MCLMQPVQSILSTKTGLHKRSFIPEAKKIKCLGLPGGSVVLNAPAKQEIQVYPWVRKIPWRSKWQPTLVFLPGKSHGQRATVHGVTKSLTGFSDQTTMMKPEVPVP